MQILVIIVFKEHVYDENYNDIALIIMHGFTENRKRTLLPTLLLYMEIHKLENVYPYLSLFASKDTNTAYCFCFFLFVCFVFVVVFCFCFFMYRTQYLESQHYCLHSFYKEIQTWEANISTNVAFKRKDIQKLVSVL